MKIWLVIAISMLILNLCLIYRACCVFTYRSTLLARLASMSQQDLRLGRSPEWRWHIYSSITYTEMVWKFWQPITSFYDERFLLSPQGEYKA